MLIAEMLKCLINVAWLGCNPILLIYFFGGVMEILLICFLVVTLGLFFFDTSSESASSEVFEETPVDDENE